MCRCGVIRYYLQFPVAVPERGAGSPRVTQPFATLYTPEGALTVRLACVKRAASVHPEPGSNSPFKTNRRSGPIQNDGADPFPKITPISDPTESTRSVLVRTHFEFYFGLSLVDLIDRSIRFSRFAAPPGARGPPCGARRYIREVVSQDVREFSRTHFLHITAIRRRADPLSTTPLSPF